MRAPIIGILNNADDVMAVAMTQAKATHNTVGVICSAICIALMSHWNLYDLGDSYEDMFIWCKNKCTEFSKFEKHFDGSVGVNNSDLGLGMDTAMIMNNYQFDEDDDRFYLNYEREAEKYKTVIILTAKFKVGEFYLEDNCYER